MICGSRRKRTVSAFIVSLSNRAKWARTGDSLRSPRELLSFNRSLLLCALVCAVCMNACSPKQVSSNGYKEGVVPGMSRARAEQILGKPQDSGPFSLPGVKAEVLSYPFGQLLVQNGKVVAISINNDPNFRGPFGIKIGMTEDQVKAAFAAHPGPRKGHREAYDAIEKTNDTRTHDIYDDTDHVMIEFAAANANDPLAPFYVSQVTYANDHGMKLLQDFTKARANGLYPDVHVNNFISEPWPSAHSEWHI